MSLLSGHQVAVQSVHIPDINTSLTNVPLTQSSKPEKVSDAGTGSKAPKILQYGSRHTIQNTGWTTKLACDPSPKRNVAPSLHKLPVPPVLQDSVKPFYPSMPLLSINKPTVLKLQSSVPLAAKTDIAIQVVGSQTTASSIAQCTVTSSSLLPTIQAQPGAGVLYTPGMNHAVLTMPTFNTRAPGKPPTVCFMPISPMMCGPVAGLPSKVPGLLAVSQAPTGVVRIPQVSLASLPLITQSCSATESKTVMSKAATKSASSASLPSAKRLLTWTSDSQKVDARMLTVKLHIEDGHITDVQEMLQQLHEPETNHVMLAMVSGAAVASNVCMSHVDANGAQFGYHDLMDGTRVRIATDTSGQRHAPFFLLPGHNGPCHFEDSSVELMTASSQAPEHVPDEADVSEVGTTFTFEPLYVSEQTLVPIPRRKLRPPQDCNEDESEYCYRCYLCSFVSDDHVEVCKHWVNSHLKELPYCCPYCDRTFFTSTKAQVHVQRQHKDRGLTTVGFQRSNYFANTLSYDIEDADVDEDSSSGETEEQEIVFEHWLQQRLQRSRSDFRCRKCCFKAKSFVEMRRHVKFIHGQSQFGHGLSKAGRQVETNNMQVNGGSRYLQAEIAWSNISEKLLIGGEVRFQCRWCLFWAESASAISLHVLRKHQWPEAVLCPSCLCSLQLSDADRSSTSVACSSCGATILLTASTDRSASSPEVRDRVFVCNVCAFKTQERDRMCRHIKYNHTKTRPYTCVYCNYVAVERSQVKMHIANHHPDQDVIIKERSDPLEHILSNLFPKLVSVQTSKTNTVLPNEVTDDDDGSGEPVPSSGVDGPLFNCEECKLQTLSLEQLIRHQHQFHKSTVVANMSMMPAEPETISPASEHFKCVICDYCCLDRSCMSRHVKYMHITARPHSCMYCSYNNVEKTKVRLHIMAHHPGRQKTVHTDRKILEEMSWQAKHLYVRIDATGKIIDENGMTLSSMVDRPSTSPHSSDSELPGDLLTDERSEGRGTTTNGDNFGSGEKEESMSSDDDDDVDVNFYPRRSMTDISVLDSVIMLDHCYAQHFASSETITTYSDTDNITVKQEPLEFDVENGAPGTLQSQFDGRHKEPTLGNHFEVKTETAKGDSLDSCGTSDGESEAYDSDDFVDSELSSDVELSHAGEPVRKKIRVAFGVDPCSEESAVGSLVIDSSVWQDPKINMMPVVELEDVLQIILAWQQNVGETDDIM